MSKVVFRFVIRSIQIDPSIRIKIGYPYPIIFNELIRFLILTGIIISLG